MGKQNNISTNENETDPDIKNTRERLLNRNF